MMTARLAFLVAATHTASTFFRWQGPVVSSSINVPIHGVSPLLHLFRFFMMFINQSTNLVRRPLLDGYLRVPIVIFVIYSNTAIHHS